MARYLFPVLLALCGCAPAQNPVAENRPVKEVQPNLALAAKKMERVSANKQPGANLFPDWEILNMRPGNWPLALLVVCGFILGFLFLMILVKSIQYENLDQNIKDEKTASPGPSHQDHS
jgi:hypothetical protein